MKLCADRFPRTRLKVARIHRNQRPVTIPVAGRFPTLRVPPKARVPSCGRVPQERDYADRC